MSNWENFIKPEPVDFTDGWRDELDFDNWPVQGGGLEALGAAVGIAIDAESASQQESVGRFAADIVTTDIDGNIVIIENQRDQTNHDHLGKILTYAGGLTASTPECHLIWVSEKVRDEHRAAIDWLNSRTDENTNFFAVEIHLFRIEDKLMPSLELVCQPNNWSRVGKKFAASEFSSSEQNLLNYWSRLLETFTNRGIKAYQNKNTSSDNWLDAGAGVSLCPWRLTRSSKKLRVALVLGTADRDTNEFLFSHIQDSQMQIENSFGESLNWQSSSKQKSRQIYVEKSIEDGLDIERWDEFIDWMAVHFEKLEKSLKPHLADAKKALDEQM